MGYNDNDNSVMIDRRKKSSDPRSRIVVNQDKIKEAVGGKERAEERRTRKRRQKEVRIRRNFKCISVNFIILIFSFRTSQ